MLNIAEGPFSNYSFSMQGHQQGCVAMRTGIHAGLWDVLPCTTKEKYICKHAVNGAVVTPAPPTQNPPKCADDWTKLASRNYCFKVEDYNQDKTSWIFSFYTLTLL